MRFLITRIVPITYGVLCPFYAKFRLEKVFSNSVRGTLNLAGLGGVATPDRLWEILGNFDAGISLDLKKRLTPEGIIILAKP